MDLGVYSISSVGMEAECSSIPTTSSFLHSAADHAKALGVSAVFFRLMLRIGSVSQRDY